MANFISDAISRLKNVDLSTLPESSPLSDALKMLKGKETEVKSASSDVPFYERQPTSDIDLFRLGKDINPNPTGVKPGDPPPAVPLLQQPTPTTEVQQKAAEPVKSERMQVPEVRSETLKDEDIIPLESIYNESVQKTENQQSPVSTTAPATQPKVLDFGNSSRITSVDELHRLQQEAEEKRRINQLGQAAAMLGGAISGASPELYKQASQLFQQNIQAADQPLKDYAARIEMEKQDPNSPYAKGLKDFIKQQYGYEVRGDVSPKELEGTLLSKIADSYEKEQYRKMQEEIKKHQLTIQQQNQALAQKRLDQQTVYQNALLKQGEQRLAQGKEAAQANRDLKKEMMLQGKNQKFMQEAAKYRDSLPKRFPSFKVSTEALAELPALEATLEDAYRNGGQSLSAAGNKLAKFMGEKGVLTDQDVVRYIQNPQLSQSIIDTMKKKTSGKLDDQSYNNIRRMLDAMKKGYEERVNKAYDEQATLFSRVHGITPQEARTYIDPDFIPGQQVTSQEVERLDPQTGKTAIFDSSTKKFLRWKNQ